MTDLFLVRGCLCLPKLCKLQVMLQKKGWRDMKYLFKNKLWFTRREQRLPTRLNFLCNMKIHPFKIILNPFSSPHPPFRRSSSDWRSIPTPKTQESEMQTSAVPDWRGQTVRLKPAKFLLRVSSRTDGWTDGRLRLLWVFLWQCLSWLLWGVRTKQSASILPQKFFAIRCPGINARHEVQRPNKGFSRGNRPEL